MEQSIRICNEIENSYNKYIELISPDTARYLALEDRVSKLDQSTLTALNYLYKYIFVKGNEPFGSVLRHFGDQLETMAHDLDYAFS